MKYTVHQLANLAGVSVRTLHYYDEIGLLKPSAVGKNGYRYYEAKELLKLQQILFFRELEFELEDIKRMMGAADYQVIEALKQQQKLFNLKQKRLENLRTTLAKTIKRMTNKQTMNDEELYDAFKDDDVKQYQEEVKQRWGNTEAYRQSMARVKKLTKREMEKIKADGKKLTKELADAMEKGIQHPDVQALIERHYQSIAFFYECPLPMYRNLGKMYVDDPRFTATYDKVRSGLAVFMRDAIGYYCDQRS